MRYRLRLYFIFTSFVAFVCTTSIHAQELIRNRIIFQNADFNALNINSSRSKSIAEGSIEHLCDDLQLYVMEFDHNLSDAELLEMGRALNAKHVFFDLKVKQRNVPNDEKFDSSTYLSLLEIPKVWDLTTGGKMFDGQDIVAVVMDEGIEIHHPDLSKNIFVNRGEIPGDFIDNDGNGFIDDVSGFNARTNLSNHFSHKHGTWVSGILGAVGNNKIGVSGINWNIKILPITAVGTVSTVIKAYDYALRMKKLYLQSNGALGANIVVTNYSGGLENAFGSDPEYKPWCDMFDLLGAQGILSVGATTNRGYDVDSLGDMPSTCTSEFLITVTSTNDKGLFTRSAGFGIENVDLGAPGENVFNLKDGGSYFSDIGTSASTPMVAGTIALMYAVPCQSFVDLVKADMVQASRFVRDAVFDGVVKTKSLESRTKYGGYLNAYNTLLQMQEACGGTLPLGAAKLSIDRVFMNGNNLEISFNTTKIGNYAVALYDAAGKKLRFEKLNVLEGGDNLYMVKDLQLPQGVYFVNLVAENSSVSSAFYAR